MSVSSTVFFGVWGTSILAWLGLGYQHREKRENRIEELASQIRHFNARNNYDRSINRDTLAKAFYSPFKNKTLKEFAENNNTSVYTYRSKIYGELGNPQWLYWTIKFHIVGTLLAFSGITYWIPGGFLPAQTYLLILYSLLATSVILYFYL